MIVSKNLNSAKIIDQAPVVQKLDSAIHWINHYPVDKYLGNRLRCPLDGDLSIGQCLPPFELLGPGFSKCPQAYSTMVIFDGP